MPPKKLIEVALPLEEINAAAKREKSIRHGHPSTLHLWWARRPLAAARAVIWSSLVDDPSAHPEQFPTLEEQNQERNRLFEILKRLVIWENSNDENVLKEAKDEIRKSMGDDLPEFLDPFAGGGAIPLEAQRLGLKAHAHDLNPVAVMINKAMIEIPPKFAGCAPVNPKSNSATIKPGSYKGATALAEDVAYYGNWMKEEAFKRIGHLYPKATLPDGSEATVIAWIWARTVKCPNPNCGCQMPLASSFELSKKKGKEAWVNPEIVNHRILYHISSKEGLKPGKTSRGVNFKCIVCGQTCDANYIKEQAVQQKMKSELMAIVAEGTSGRLYIEPNQFQIDIANIQKPESYPTGTIAINPRDIRAQLYGMYDYSDLFTPRQLTALTTFSDLVGEAYEKVRGDIADALGIAHEDLDCEDLDLDQKYKKLLDSHNIKRFNQSINQSINQDTRLCQ